MASKFSLPDTSFYRAELARRVALAAEPEREMVDRPPLMRFAAEAAHALDILKRPFRTVPVERAAVPRVVMLLPGFATHPVRMRYMAQQLERAGHTVKRWGMGFNWGPTQDRVEQLEQRIVAISERYDDEVVLVGWSLGGLFARDIAHRIPDRVAKVVTMGSPFSGNPRANNVWRAYQFVTGHRVDAVPIDTKMRIKPPVETVAFWSPRDGIISARCARGQTQERDRAVALRCTHMGFSSSPECIAAVLAELKRS
ncbi:MAG: alpha/beta fold hydrolase [Parerythrobacter sp.]